MDALTHAVEAYVNRWPHQETPMLVRVRRAAHLRQPAARLFKRRGPRGARGDGARVALRGPRVHQGLRRVRPRVLAQDRRRVRRPARAGQRDRAALRARLPQGRAVRGGQARGTGGRDRRGRCVGVEGCARAALRRSSAGIEPHGRHSREDRAAASARTSARSRGPRWSRRIATTRCRRTCGSARPRRCCSAACRGLSPQGTVPSRARRDTSAAGRLSPLSPASAPGRTSRAGPSC